MNIPKLTAATASTLILIISQPASAGGQLDATAGIFNSNDITLGPWEIDGKNIFEINRELRAQRLARQKQAESSANVSESGPGTHDSSTQKKATVKSYKLQRS